MGQWKENDVAYIYTKRRDVGNYECFVGSMNGQEIFIKEAGEHCQRDIDPNRYGMQLKQTKYCNSNHRKLNKHPIIGHMNAVNVPSNRSHLGNSFDPVPAFSPMPPENTTHDLSNSRVNDLRDEPTTYRNQETSTLVSILSKSTDQKNIDQHEFNEKTITTDSNETIQFIVNNDTSLAKDDQQYVVSTVVTGPGSIEDTNNKSSTHSIHESDFNCSSSFKRINLLMFFVVGIFSVVGMLD